MDPCILNSIRYAVYVCRNYYGDRSMKKIMFILLFFLLCFPVLAVHEREHIDRVTYVESVGKVYNVSTLEVGSTDYLFNESGKLFVQIDTDGVPEENATCHGFSWFPNSTVLFEDEFMVHLDQGIYFHDFIVAETEGVYPVAVTCTFKTFTEEFFPESLLVEEGDQVGGSVTDMYSIDGSFLTVTETVGSGRTMSFNVSFIDIQDTDDINELVLDIFVRRLRVGTDPLGDNVHLKIFNYTSGEFLTVFDGTDYTLGFVRRQIEINLGNFSDVIQNETIVLNINDTLTASDGDNRDTDLDLDFVRLLVVKTLQNTTVQNIRGSGEFNIKETFSGPSSGDFDISLNIFLLFFYSILIVSLGFIRIPAYMIVVGFLGMLIGLVLIVPMGVAVGGSLSMLGALIVFMGMALFQSS